MIQGNLEDVTIVDVLQFIHLGRRSGTLRVSIDGRTAQVGFHRGRIVSAWGPVSIRLGDMLVEENAITADALAAALTLQESEHPRRSLGQILIATEQLAAEVVYSAVERQIERTIYDLVTWQDGAFAFALDDLEPMDDIGLYPEDVIPNIELDTQVMMLEAVRIFDERNREGPKEKAGPRVEDLPDPAIVLKGVGQSQSLLPAMSGRPEDAPRARPITAEPHFEPSPESWPILQIVTKDSALYDAISEALPRPFSKVLRVSPRDAGSPPPGAEPPIVLVDVRRAQVPVRGITSIRRARPRATVLAVREADANLAEAYEAGAVNVIPADPQLILSVYRSLARYRASNSPEQAIQNGVRAGFAKLRRVLGDMRSGFVSATMALNLMHTIADSVERSILFLVRGKSLVALGAFGLGAQGEALAGLTKGLAIPLADDSGFARTLHAGKSVAMTFDEARLPARLAAMVGRPRSGQVVMFPVLGSKKVIAVIYTDNGRSMSAIEEVDILELATAQMGFAFENELLRHQMARQDIPIDGTEPGAPLPNEPSHETSQRVTMRINTQSGEDLP